MLLVTERQSIGSIIMYPEPRGTVKATEQDSSVSDVNNEQQ